MVGLHISALRIIELRRASRGEGEMMRLWFDTAGCCRVGAAGPRSRCVLRVARVCECEMLLRLMWRAEMC